MFRYLSRKVCLSFQFKVCLEVEFLNYLKIWLHLVINSFRLKDCPQNFTVALEASLLGQLFIFRTISQPWALSFDIPASRKGVYLFCNPANDFSGQTHVDPSCKCCGFFRVSLCGIVNQLFNFSVTGFCKKYSFVLHDRLKG